MKSPLSRPTMATCLILAATLTEYSTHAASLPADVNPSLFNLQTGIDTGSTFAGGMTIDNENNRIYLTGGTYARGFFAPQSSFLGVEDVTTNSDCYFLAVDLEDAASTPAKWNSPMRLGYVNDIEACSTVHYQDNGHHRVFLGASASGGSIGLEDIEGDQLPRKSDVSMFGEVISLSLDHVYSIAPAIPQHYIFGGSGMFHSNVNYPFAITSNEHTEEKDEAIFVASLYSKYEGAMADEDEIDLTSPYLEGNVWGISIQKININPSKASSTATLLENPTHMEYAWQKSLETDSFQALQATDLLYVNDYLLLAGSTYDTGATFAGEKRVAQQFQDYDGFLMKLDPASGDILPNSTKSNSTMRIENLEREADDLVLGICLHPADATGFVPYVYVVGSTCDHVQDSHDGYGTEDTHKTDGWVMKVDLISMEPVWSDLISGGGISAVDCAVSGDGSKLYVGGEAHGDTSIGKATSNGGDDVWVRQYGALSGEYAWEQQLGSQEDESLAKGGAIAVDSDNNVIIFGNTLGSMGRKRSDDLERPDTPTNDIFVTLLSAHDGKYLSPNPAVISQIPKYFFAQEKTKHFGWITSMISMTIVLVVFVVACQSDWKPIQVRDMFRDFKKSGEGKTLYDEQKDGLVVNRPNGFLDLSHTEASETEAPVDELSSVSSAVSSLYTLESAARNARKMQNRTAPSYPSNQF